MIIAGSVRLNMIFSFYPIAFTLSGGFDNLQKVWVLVDI